MMVDADAGDDEVGAAVVEAEAAAGGVADEDGGGGSSNQTAEKKFEAKLTAEWENCKPQFESLDLSFDDFKDQYGASIKAELAAEASSKTVSGT